MYKNDQVVLFPFRLSGSRMRRGAELLHRQGRPLDALTLLWHAARQEDTLTAWQALADELIATGNWETALPVLGRVLSRNTEYSLVNLGMAKCLGMLGDRPLAINCAFTQVLEDRLVSECSGASALLDEMMAARGRSGERSPGRVRRLFNRGRDAWQRGEHVLAERRFRRALRLAQDKCALLDDIILLCDIEHEAAMARRYICLALRHDPEDALALVALAELLRREGRRRLAHSFLRRAGEHTVSVQAEGRFLAEARAQRAWGEMQRYLNARMKHQPYRKALLDAQAELCARQGDAVTARQLWLESITVDPDDRRVIELLHGGAASPSEALTQAAERMPMAELLRPGTRTRQLLDWCLCGQDAAERRTAMALLSAHCTEGAVIARMKEMLCEPFLEEDMRRWALSQLEPSGEADGALMVVGRYERSYSTRRTRLAQVRHPWRRFRALLLRHATDAGCRDGERIIALAADIWRRLSPADRMEAVTRNSYVWGKAVLILYLRGVRLDQAARRVAVGFPSKTRRIRRVLRRITLCMLAEPVT